MLVITNAGVQAINDVKDGVTPIPGLKLDIVEFKVTDGLNDPSATDTAADFETDGTVHFTSDAASGHITNKTLIDANTFHIDIIVPSEEPQGGGSFDVTKIGLYVPDPNNQTEKILFASTKFENKFIKEAPSVQSAGNSLILTLVLTFDHVQDAITVQDPANRDMNLLTEFGSIDGIGVAHEYVDRTVRVTNEQPIAGTGKRSFLLHSTKNNLVDSAEWVPDNHSLLFPIHALPAMTNGVVADGKTHSSTTLRFLYYHADLTDTDAHVFNNFPASHESLLVSFFIDNPARSGAQEGVGGKIRRVSSVEQDLYYDDEINGPTNNGSGNELITIVLATPITPLPALNNLLKIWVANDALSPGSGGGGGGSGVLVDGTPEPTPSKMVKRDENGRAKVAEPIESDQIATKNTVDQAKNEVQLNLTNHESDNAAHANIRDAEATPDTFIFRDAAGRAKVVDPAVDGDIANMIFVETRATQVEANITAQLDTMIDSAMTTFLDDNLDTNWLDPRFTTHNTATDAHANLFDEAATPSKAVMRASDGSAKVLMAASPDNSDAVNFERLTTDLDTHNNATDAHEDLFDESATFNKAVMRDSTGRGQVVTDSNATGNYIANAEFVNNRINTEVDSALNDAARFSGVGDDQATPEKLVLRNSSGQASFSDPDANDHAVNKQYMARNAPSINPSDSPKNGDVKVDNATGTTRIYIYANGLWAQVFPPRYL